MAGTELSPLHRYVFPVVWVVGCVAIMVVGTAAAGHFLCGLFPFLFGLSPRWEIKPDWTASFLKALLCVSVLSVISVWKWRRDKVRQKARSN